MTEYRKKLKNRLYLAVGYVLVGVIMLCVSFVSGIEDSFFMPFGIVFIVCGIIRGILYVRTTRDEQAVRRQEIKETDERNLKLASQARSMAFSFYILIGGAAVIVLRFANMQAESQMAAYSVCLIMLLYLICYLIARRKY